jgi:Cu(I)/Ag(I) efflux system membrane protein CusA/SilA
VVAIIAGLLPIMWSTGTCSEIMQRIAVPMIGGMISSTVLTLIVIPAIFGLVKGFRLPSGSDDRRPAAEDLPAATPDRVSEPAE